MTPIHCSRLAAVLLGTALLSCANGGAREDNQAHPGHEPRFARVEPAPPPPPPPPDGMLNGGPQWREPMDRMQPRMFVLGGPGDMAQAGLDHQGGPLLGVSVERSGDGLKVSEVMDTSLAHSAGIAVGDVLLRIGDEHIDNVGDVRRALHGKHPGDQVKLAVIRAGQGIVELTGTVPEPPADAPKAQGAPDDEASRLSGGDGARGGFLGVEVEDGAAPAGAQDGAAPATSEPGVLVAAVVSNSAAWFAGLEANDRLLSIDGQALSSRADLVGAVASKEPGSLVELKYVRNGQEHTTSVRLGRRGPMGLLGGLQGLNNGLRGLQLPGPPGMGRGPGPLGHLNLRLAEPFDQDDLSNLLGGMQIQPGADAHSIRVQIDNDQMTIERDGDTKTYERGPDGQWHPADGSGSDSSKA